MRSSVVLELGLERSGGDDASVLHDAALSVALPLLRGLRTPIEGLRIDVSAQRLALRMWQPSAEGSEAREALTAVLTQVVEQLALGCAWNERPLGEALRWLVALRDADVLPLNYRGLWASRGSQGHPRLSPGPLTLASAELYPDTLRAAHVWIDAAERERQLREGLARAAGALGCDWVRDGWLLSRWVSRTEAPTVQALLLGDDLASWPAGLLATVARESFGAFVARKLDREIPTGCLWITDGPAEPVEAVRARDRIHGRVAQVASLLADDRHRPLHTLAANVPCAPYEVKWLGALEVRRDRLARLARDLLPQALHVDVVRVEALLGAERGCATSREFPRLRGEVGAWLARVHGLDPLETAALDYARTERGNAPTGTSGQRQMRTAFSLGEAAIRLAAACQARNAPTGAIDPLDGRSAARWLARVAIDGQWDVHLGDLLQATLMRLPPGRCDADTAAARATSLVRKELAELLRRRVSPDVLEAAMPSWHDGYVRDLVKRTDLLSRLVAAGAHQDLLLDLKRCYAWTRDAPAGEVDATQLPDDRDRALLGAFRLARSELTRALGARDLPTALSAIVQLGPSLRDFFGQLHVTHSTEAAAARLQLLAAVTVTTRQLAHFHLLAAGPTP